MKNFDPFNNEIFLTGLSAIQANKILANSKSSIIINPLVRLVAEKIELNGGNCEINELFKLYRKHDRECKKFSPSFKYSGTCATNPLPTNLNIKSFINPSNSQELTFSLEANSSLKQIEWSFNHQFRTSKNKPTQQFNNPGRHLVEAVLSADGGYFRKIGKYLSIAPQNINNGQTVFFNFAGSSSAPDKIDGFVDLRKVTLLKSKKNPEIYTSEFKLDLTKGTKSIVIPYFLYQAKFSLIIMPKIDDPELYISKQIDNIINFVSTNPDGQPIDQFQQNIMNMLDEVKTKVKQLTLVQKQELASMLQANLSEQLHQVVVKNDSTLKKDSRSILDFFISSASAQALPPDTTMQDKITIAYMIQYLLYGTIGVALGVDALNVGITHIFKNPLFGSIAIAAGAYIIYQTLKAEQALLKRIYLPLDEVLSELTLIDTAQSSEFFYTHARSKFKGIGYSDSASPVEDVREVVSITKSINNLLLPTQILIDEANTFLETLTFTSRFTQLPSLEFPNPTLDSYLSTDYMSVSILRSENGNVSLNVTKNGPNLGIKITSVTTQNVTLRIRYTNVLLNAEGFKDINVLVVAEPPKAIIEVIEIDNLQLKLNSIGNSSPENLNYLWDFGDSSTSNLKNPTHTYSKAGVYTVSLKISDNHGNSSTSTIQIEVKILETTFFLRVDPRGTYLYTYPYTANPASSLDLLSLNIEAGDIITLQAVGSAEWYQNGPEFNYGMLGVFSNGGMFLQPGPMTTATESVSPPTLMGNYPTDIPYDRIIPSETTVDFQVPVGATSLLFSLTDGHFDDNSDPNGDLGVTVKVIVRKAVQAPLN